MSSIRVLHWRPTRRLPCAAGLDEDVFSPSDFLPRLRTQLLILQPTPFCNIRCDYCYLPDRDTRTRMPMDVVRAAVRRLVEDDLLGEELTVVWHAGEPTVLPPAWYEDAFAAVRQEIGGRAVVTHSMQTNATLIDASWCDFFLRHGVRLGVSVDGPAALHDAHRRTRNGHGTHALVRRGMRFLREAGVPFHAIAVVTAATLADADAFVDFFEAEGVQDIGCNFDEAEGGHAVSSLDTHEASHAAFVERLLDRTLAADGRLRMRELQHAFEAIRRGLPTVAWRGRTWPLNSQALPFALVTVAVDGRFSTFSPELLGQASPAHEDFAFGDVRQTGYFEATRGPAFARLWREIRSGIASCERCCAHFAYCGGGAPANKFFENGTFASTETLYCRTMVQRPFDVVLRRLEGERATAVAAVP
jgi:uncharacterized protein